MSTNPARVAAWYRPDCGYLHLSEGGNVPSRCPDGHSDPKAIFEDNPDTNAARWDGVQWTPYPDPIRPPETDEEPWSVVAADALPAILPLPLVIALAVIVGILVACAVR